MKKDSTCTDGTGKTVHLNRFPPALNRFILISNNSVRLYYIHSSLVSRLIFAQPQKHIYRSKNVIISKYTTKSTQAIVPPTLHHIAPNKIKTTPPPSVRWRGNVPNLITISAICILNRYIRRMCNNVHQTIVSPTLPNKSRSLMIYAPLVSGRPLSQIK